MPTEPLPIAQVNTGMTVLDPAGAEIGTVTEVQMAGADAPPDASGVSDHLRKAGYFRIGDRYATGDQIADITEGEPGIVTLTVPADELTKAQ
jgi:hypothetical protein